MSIKVYDGADGKRFQAYARAEGRRVYLGTYDTRREAEETIEDHRVTQRRIERGELPPQTDQRRTFGAAVKLWLAALERAKSRSHEEYASRMELHVLPVFGGVALVDIGKPDVVRWRDELLERVAPPTVNTCLGTLSSAFSWFVEQGWIGANPCARVKKAKHIARVFPWLQTGETITRLLSACPDCIRTIIAILVGTGMRLDEALHLHWDDIDLDHRLIAVHRGRKGTTKGGKLRHVPIFDSVLPVLKEMKLARGGNALLWPGKPRDLGKPIKPLTRPSVRKPFKTAAKRAGLPPELRVHDLRHTFASLYLADGGDIFKLSRILGHSSVAITEKTYAHLMPTAFEADYGRVRFRMPAGARVVTLHAAAQ